MKVTNIPIVFSAFDTVAKGLLKGLELFTSELADDLSLDFK